MRWELRSRDGNLIATKEASGPNVQLEIIGVAPDKGLFVPHFTTDKHIIVEIRKDYVKYLQNELAREDLKEYTGEK